VIPPSLKRSVRPYSAPRRGTLLSDVGNLVAYFSLLAKSVAIPHVNALRTTAARVAYATRREEKLPWAQKRTAR
jgi:hypothetical protein